MFPNDAQLVASLAQYATFTVLVLMCVLHSYRPRSDGTYEHHKFQIFPGGVFSWIFLEARGGNAQLATSLMRPPLYLPYTIVQFCIFKAMYIKLNMNRTDLSVQECFCRQYPEADALT